MPLQIKVAYAYPHRMRSVEAGDGSVREDGKPRLFKELVPGSPTRPARVTDDSTWWEDHEFVPGGAFVNERALAAAARWAGWIVREV